MRVLATYHIKGGVGKSCTAVNLSYLAARAGLRTLLWDLDPQAAATYLFRVRPRVRGGGKGLVKGTHPAQDSIRGTDFDGLDLLPADFTYRGMDLLLDDAKRPTRRLGQLMRALGDEYDLVMLDCPPGASLVSENILHAADTLLVPLIPTPLSLRAFDQLTEFAETLPGGKPTILAFFSMVDRRRSLHRQAMAEFSAQLPGQVCPVSIPSSAIVEQMTARREPVPAFAPRSAVALAYQQLWKAVAAAW